MRGRILTPLAALAVVALPLSSQKPTRPAPAPAPAPAAIDIPTARKAVVTIQALDANGQLMASGTGFFITGGFVVTAAHVLEDAAGCRIELSDGQQQRCSVAAADSAKDVAMLTVSGSPPYSLRWGSSESMKDGDEVTVISNPLGQLPGTVSRGIISASRVVSGTKLLQISAAISHGSSGAPVLNPRGQVIGIVRSTIEAGQSLNFATATDAVRNLNNDQVAVAEGQTLLTPKNLITAAGSTGARGSPAGASTSRTSGSESHSIDVGQTQQGSLTRNDVLLDSDTTYAQAWTIQGRASQTITIDLESDAFDAYLFLRGPGVAGGRDFQDDDSGGNCNARLTATFPQSGEYEIVVNTAGQHYMTGAFTLSVTSGSKPKSLAACHRSNQ